MKKGKLIVISAPSGCGKSTIIKAIINDELRLVSEQLDVKTATINELESKVKTLINL